jgi:type II secretory pathway pseudopilin PulG
VYFIWFSSGSERDDPIKHTKVHDRLEFMPQTKVRGVCLQWACGAASGQNLRFFVCADKVEATTNCHEEGAANMCAKTRCGHPAFTLIEVLIVIAVVIFLMGAIFGATAKLRDRARKQASQTLVNRINTAIGVYQLKFYEPPLATAPDGSTGIKALTYYLTSAFRFEPAREGDVRATDDVGPCIKLDSKDIVNGKIIDAWGHPLVYLVKTRVQDKIDAAYYLANGTNVVSGSGANRENAVNQFVVLVPHVYSCGANGLDELGLADDLICVEK